LNSDLPIDEPFTKVQKVGFQKLGPGDKGKGPMFPETQVSSKGAFCSRCNRSGHFASLCLAKWRPIIEAGKSSRAATDTGTNLNMATNNSIPSEPQLIENPLVSNLERDSSFTPNSSEINLLCYFQCLPLSAPSKARVGFFLETGALQASVMAFQ
jgi:hypothetical protein